MPHLRDSRGTFIQIGSALSYRGIPLQAAYCATKAAVRTFMESARAELRKEDAGVDISVILPAAINTPQFNRGRQTLWTRVRLNRALIAGGLGLATIGLLGGLAGRIFPRHGMSQSWRF